MFRVVILGHGEMLGNLIAGVQDANCKIVGVMRYERLKKLDIYTKIKDFILPSTEYSYIKSYNVPELKSKSANSEQFRKEILKLNPDLVIVGTWGEKLKKESIQLPKIAMINVHPSMLPKYRGPNPYLETIRHQEKTTGITFHLMSEEYDAGAILLQKQIEIKPEDTGKELKKRTVIVARQAVTELLNSLADDFIIPVDQSEERATYYPQITREDIMLDFNKPAEAISAHIRGFYPWSKTYFSYKSKFFTPNPYYLEILDSDTEFITAGTIIEKSSENHSLSVICGDGKVLKMNNLKLFGKLNNLFTTQYIKYFVELNDLVS